MNDLARNPLLALLSMGTEISDRILKDITSPKDMRSLSIALGIKDRNSKDDRVSSLLTGSSSLYPMWCCVADLVPKKHILDIVLPKCFKHNPVTNKLDKFNMDDELRCDFPGLINMIIRNRLDFMIRYNDWLCTVWKCALPVYKLEFAVMCNGTTQQLHAVKESSKHHATDEIKKDDPYYIYGCLCALKRGKIGLVRTQMCYKRTTYKNLATNFMRHIECFEYNDIWSLLQIKHDGNSQLSCTQYMTLIVRRPELACKVLENNMVAPVRKWSISMVKRVLHLLIREKERKQMLIVLRKACARTDWRYNTTLDLLKEIAAGKL